MHKKLEESKDFKKRDHEASNPSYIFTAFRPQVDGGPVYTSRRRVDGPLGLPVSPSCRGGLSTSERMLVSLDSYCDVTSSFLAHHKRMPLRASRSGFHVKMDGDNLCVDGGARAWLEGNTITAAPSYLTPETLKFIRRRTRTSLLSSGLAGPLCWYKVQLEQANIDENAKLSAAAREFAHPLLFIACTKDYVVVPILGDYSHGKYAKGPVTRKEIDAEKRYIYPCKQKYADLG
ncbi:hypothetical protein C8R45DRAFT_1136022 [Mycena sanguinolenta]|nr:hypothetical protein C8R45DRAFT_1136022 [Mycena sanguinolenta]